MKNLYRIFRSLVLIMIGLILVVPPVVYIGLELDCVQNPVRKMAETELSKLLGVEVSIGSVSIAPFNRATLRDVTVTGSGNDTIARIDRLGAGIDIYPLIVRGDLVVGYAELIGFDARIHRATPHSPTNLQPIIDALRPKKPRREPTRFDLAINTIVIRRSQLSYDVDSITCDSSGRFSPHHAAVSDLRADIRIPRLRNNEIVITLNQLAFAERSGLTVDQLSAKAVFDSTSVLIVDPVVKLPESELYLSSVSLPTKGNFQERMRCEPLNVAILPGSHITPSDLSAFLPALKSLNASVALEADIEGKLDNLTINHFHASADGGAAELNIHNARIDNLTHLHTDSFAADATLVDIKGYGAEIAELIDMLTPRPLTPKVATLLSNCGAVDIMGNCRFAGGLLSFDGSLSSEPGMIDISACLTLARGALAGLSGEIEAEEFDLGTLLNGIVAEGKLKPGEASFAAGCHLAFNAGRPSGKVSSAIGRTRLGSREITGISASATIEHATDFDITLAITDPQLTTDINSHICHRADSSFLAATFRIDDADLSDFAGFFSNRRLTLEGSATLDSFNPDTACGEMLLDHLRITRGTEATDLKGIRATINGTSVPKRIRFISEPMTLDLHGNYCFATLVPQIKDAVRHVFPALFPAPSIPTQASGIASAGAGIVHADASRINDFEFDIKISSSEEIERAVPLPVSVVFPATVSGRVAPKWPYVAIEADIPFLQKGNKLIEETRVYALIDGTRDSIATARMEVSGIFPVKSGKVDLDITVDGFDNRIDSRIAWSMDREREFSGNIGLAAQFARKMAEDDDPADSPGNAPLDMKLHFNPGKAVFNDTVWNIAPSEIRFSDRRLSVDRFKVSRPGQQISINGIASESADDSVHVRLDDINLDYVFETLGIANAMFGGRATGNFYAAAALSQSPHLYTNDLHVAGIKYNYCRMGDADIRSRWDVDEKAVRIYADIAGEHGNVSTIDGMIKPMTEELDFRFHADDVPVGFLKPFMEAFTSDVKGHASGDAHLYGTFKLLDMTGDLFARDFTLKLDFTNCYYSTTDSIHLRPGRIDIPSVRLRDPMGHTALLNGLVTHRCFKEPTFDFAVTEAKSLLVYDIAPTAETIWYGKVFGNGGVHVKGVPGRIDIGVDMATAPGSSFSFVLSDSEEASDYDFITFRDITPADPNLANRPPTTLDIIADLRKRVASHSDEQSSPSIYNMEFDIDVNPNTLVTLVMDPVGGDRIRARGTGNMRLAYNSADDDLKLYGRYTLTEGSYNFTLQDIIIKEFTIDDGSEISFTGNPYAPQLDVKAIYSLNANLSDLDESFLQDRELSRTNVPIQAVMDVTGDVRQPAIGFDLRFPTLTDDTYRKVRSIISTDDMMNRQIIYLLALNRFYTPDYVAATRGNELVSVASSTISSQLSNILGQLSDNWTIAPNFRSDRGDFSDLEFDVALSSRLLNNRLLFNGNLGYRDKSMNNNSFIGDFDIEYLLNRSGSLRLKAYNRYNDRNFYVKSALTTQGIGLLYRRDFDVMFGFLRRKKADNTDEEKPEKEKKEEKPTAESSGSDVKEDS